MKTLKPAAPAPRTIFTVRKEVVTAKYIPLFEHVAQEHRVIRVTPRGYRLCAVDAPENAKGSIHMEDYYTFHNTKAEAMDEVIRQAQEVIGYLDEVKAEALDLIAKAASAA